MRRVFHTLHGCCCCSRFISGGIITQPRLHRLDTLHATLRLLSAGPQFHKVGPDIASARRVKTDGEDTPRQDSADNFGTLRVKSSKPNASALDTKLPPSANRGRRKHTARTPDKALDDNSRNLVDEPSDVTQAEADFFGTVDNPDLPHILQQETEEEITDAVEFGDKPDRIYTGKSQADWWYVLRMKKYIDKQDLPTALEFLEVRMLQEDRVRPLRNVYDMLIAACGRAGYADKAFMLYKGMRERGHTAKDSTYVGLFNACAESPFAKDGLFRAKRLREELHTRGHIPNDAVYHTMIKAFGKRGDVLTAFQLADEMQANGVFLNDASFCHLLMACIGDKESGLKHAIEVWRLMLKNNFAPNLNHYNLLLKCIRECGVGHVEYANELFADPGGKLPLRGDVSVVEQCLLEAENRTQQSDDVVLSAPPDPRQSVTNQVWAFLKHPKGNWSEKFEKETRDRRKPKEEDDGVVRSVSEVVRYDELQNPRTLRKRGKETWWYEEPQEEFLKPVSPGLVQTDAVDRKPVQKIPDILAPVREGQYKEGAIRLGDVTRPHQRFALFGGYVGFLARMFKDKVYPDEKCLTQLIELIPLNRIAEDELVEVAKKLWIKLHVDFWNTLIKKRCSRGDLMGALEILDYLDRKGVKATEMTFGCLAIGVHTKTEAKDLMAEMEKREVKPNIRIFGAMMNKAVAYREDPFFLLYIISQMSKCKVLPDERLLRQIEQFRMDTRKNILRQEKRQHVEPMFSDPKFLFAYKQFEIIYDSWTKHTLMHEGDHPWQVYGFGKSEKKVKEEDLDDEEVTVSAQSSR